MMEIHIAGTGCDAAMDQMHILMVALVTFQLVEHVKVLADMSGEMRQIRLQFQNAHPSQHLPRMTPNLCALAGQ